MTIGVFIFITGFCGTLFASFTFSASFETPLTYYDRYVGQTVPCRVRTAARSPGAARYLTREHFEAPTFLQEVEWLIAQALLKAGYHRLFSLRKRRCIAETIRNNSAFG
jgi:hypothetical protein